MNNYMETWIRCRHGARCADFELDCPRCRAWAAYDLLRGRPSKLDTIISAARRANKLAQEAGEYTCADCGKLRTKAEGGTTFTVCDECWDKHYAEPAGRSRQR